MGNEESSIEEVPGLRVLSQGAEHLWSVILQQEEEEGKCLFVREPGSDAQTDLCRAGVEHLRLLRHPNILKFLSCELSHDCITMATEPVLPLNQLLEKMCMEGLVMGWRSVAQGLIFLHDKAGISHNSLSSECLYVSSVNSQWKIGGFEAASQHKRIDPKFLSVIASIRPPKSIPPEDKSPSSSSTRHVPCHARDIWAFGHVMLVLLEDTALESHASDALFTYVQERMLNTDPQLRPTVSAVLEQLWMSNGVAHISDFLSNLTVKTKSTKDQFFSDLPHQLHSLPPLVVAEHLVPLLVSPLVMAEPVPRHSLWKHLLTPASNAIPRRKTFDSTHICPLLSSDLYVAHVVPLLLNLMECREAHVRLVLLEHIACYAPICPQGELIDVVLPEVLLGLQETQDDLVQATLRALADLVPLLGADVVMGTSRTAVFADTKPRTNAVPTLSLHSPSDSLPAPRHPVVQDPPHTTARQKRAEQMREKREQQKRKRETTRAKLGKVTDGSDLHLLGSDREEEEEEEGSGREGVPSDHPQYSPSVSHDDESSNASGDLNALADKSESVKRSLNAISAPHALSRPNQRKEEEEEEEEDEEEWEGLQEDELGWGSSWGSAHEDRQTDTGDRPEISATDGGGRLKLNRSTNKELESPVSSPSSMGVDKPSRQSGGMKLKQKSPNSAPSKKLDSLKGRLRAEDIQRLEEQASWTKEPDFFADMEPSIVTSGKHVESPKSPASATNSDGHSLLSSMKYQPSQQEEEGTGWDDEDWNEF